LNNSSLNVYNFSIQAYISSAIIENGLFVRLKQDGDSYRYGGISRKLKKVFNDRGIPPSRRTKIPIICDNDGIVWVPGLSVRDGAVDKKDNLCVTFYFSLSQSENELYPAIFP